MKHGASASIVLLFHKCALLTLALRIRMCCAVSPQVSAAKQYSAPLDAAQIPFARRVLGNLPSVFAEDRIRNMSDAISGML